jgi:hypothetical protein
MDTGIVHYADRGDLMNDQEKLRMLTEALGAMDAAKAIVELIKEDMKEAVTNYKRECRNVEEIQTGIRTGTLQRKLPFTADEARPAATFAQPKSKKGASRGRVRAAIA